MNQPDLAFCVLDQRRWRTALVYSRSDYSLVTYVETCSLSELFNTSDCGARLMEIKDLPSCISVQSQQLCLLKMKPHLPSWIPMRGTLALIVYAHSSTRCQTQFRLVGWKRAKEPQHHERRPWMQLLWQSCDAPWAEGCSTPASPASAESCWCRSKTNLRSTKTHFPFAFSILFLFRKHKIT